MVATALRGTQTVSDVYSRPRDELRKLQAEHQALREAYERLQHRDRMQQELATMLVHDLKAPLAVMLASLELLTLELELQLDADQRSIFASAGRAGQEMLHLITNLLEVQRLEAGRMPVCPEPLDLTQLLQGAVSQARFLAQQRGVALHLRLPEGLACAWADAHLTARVVTNLLHNALRFTPRGGEIWVTGQARGGYLTISVSDGGPGIPAAQQKQIFDRYYQGEPAPRQGTAGVGLGLAFCKLAVEAQRGSIGVESAPGAGARFNFTLPAWRGSVPEFTPMPLAVDY
jgi:signal transduction histidine kinase